MKTKTKHIQTFNRLISRHLRQLTERSAALDDERGRVNGALQRVLPLTDKLKNFKLEFRRAGAETLCLVTFKGGSSFGVARQSPADQDRPEIGENIALSRAIANLLE